jgi:diguanylate cyclase
MSSHRRFGPRAQDISVRDDPAVIMRALLDRSLGLIGDCVDGGAESASVVADVQECRDVLATSASQEVIESVVSACLDTCRTFLAATGAGELERRQSAADLVGVIRGAMSTVQNDAGAGAEHAAQAAQRFDAVLRLDNLADLRARLAAEIAAFKQANYERQQAFAQQLSESQARVVELEAGIIRNEREATMDALTGLINRGAFDRTVTGLAAMPGAQFSLAMIDVDHLKQVNDAHGHLAGDRVLTGLAQTLKAAVRSEDLVARYGGDEFAVLMRDSALRRSESCLWNAISAFASSRLTADDGRAIVFTVSGGIAELSQGDTVHAVLVRANAALADAKRDGRNRIASRRHAGGSAPPRRW